MVSSRSDRVTDKSDDVYHDYTTVVIGLALDSANIKWRLESSATYTEFQSWESDMDLGFARCRTLDSTFGGHTEYVLAYRRVDETLASLWRAERSAMGITSSWANFKQFLSAKFVAPIEEKDRVVVPEEAVPLRGLNMQLKRVHDDVCMTADRGQRWTLFQTQCTIKEKSCKLIIDSGSYCNGISKAVVDSLEIGRAHV